MENSREAARRSWEKFLDPGSVRFSLMVGAVYLTAYEILLSAMVDRLKDFYTIGWSKDDGPTIGPDYKDRVLSRHRMPYIASALWFVEMEALGNADVDALSKIREHRNFIAHNIPRIVMEADVEVNVELLGEIVRIIKRLDQWWLRYVEIPSNPDFDDQEITDDQISESFSMRLYNLHLLLNLLTGNEQPLIELQSAFNKVWQSEGNKGDKGGEAGGASEPALN